MSNDPNKRIIFVEINELCPTLLDKWMADGNLPNFKSLYDESAVFITESDESNPQNMEPWIQWYSLHTGLPFSEHKVFHLTDGTKAGHTEEALKSGQHHPDGCFWVQKGIHSTGREKVSLLDVLPTILHTFNITQPEMRGNSLV